MPDDDVSSRIGDNPRGVAAGENIKQTQQENQNQTIVNVGDAILLHIMDMKLEIRSIRQDVSDAHEERGALLAMVNDLLNSQHPRWFQILMVSMAAAMLLLATLIWVKANGMNDINWLAVFFCVYIVVSVGVDIGAWLLFARYRREQDERLHTTVNDLLKRIEAMKFASAEKKD